jgi:hypothetical protein
MMRIQQVVDSLFDRFPVEDLGGGIERSNFDRLRDGLATAADWSSTLRRLYQADRCDEFALGLLWLTDRLEQDGERTVALPEEEEVFHRTLRSGLGLSAAAFSGFGESTPADGETTVLEPSPTPDETMASFAPTAAADDFAQPAFDAPTAEPEPSAEEPVASEETSASIPMGAEDDIGTSDPEIFGRLLERFLESVQSGSEDRTELLGRLRANCRAVRADSTQPEEYQRYAEVLDDFLGYIDQHQLMDDIRVMNLVTNLQEPFGQWVSTDEESRTGILEQCVDMHREFRTMFE